MSHPNGVRRGVGVDFRGWRSLCWPTPADFGHALGAGPAGGTPAAPGHGEGRAGLRKTRRSRLEASLIAGVGASVDGSGRRAREQWVEGEGEKALTAAEAAAPLPEGEGPDPEHPTPVAQARRLCHPTSATPTPDTRVPTPRVHPMCLITASPNSEHLTFLTEVSPSAFMSRSKS